MNVLSLLAGRTPRLSLLVYWMVRPAKFVGPYGGHRTWPLLGLVFQPRTTLEYVLPVTAGRHAKIQWLALGAGVVGDAIGVAYRTTR